jgi:nucleoside triphosphate diphosphatase
VTPGAFAPEGAVPSSQGGRRLLDLVRIQARLREECPWDREQTHETLARHLLEETHELLEAIDADDPAAIREELGDVLLQVTFHAQIASDEGRWDIDDVADGLLRKLIHRHPHVFGQVEVRDADEVLSNWEKLKTEEKGEHGLDEDIPSTLPALARAAKVQRRAAGRAVTVDPPAAAETAIAGLRAEVDELAADWGSADAESRIGDLLFAVVAVARATGIDPETALRRATGRFAASVEG